MISQSIPRAILLGCFLLTAAFQAWAEGDEPASPDDSIMRQVSSEPGHLAYGGSSSMFNEHVETSNGQLSISHEDLSIPLHAGRRLSIVRTYNSHSDYLEQVESSRIGIGWTMHMGRVAFPVKYRKRICSHSSAHLSNQFDNPMMEMPSGGRKLFFIDRNDPTRFISSDNWILYCELNGDVRVKSPDGTRYDMTLTYDSDKYRTGFIYPTLITDINGNEIRISYTASFDANGFALETISAEDVTVEFTYHAEAKYLETMRVNDGRVWTFEYETTGPGVYGNYYLKRVDGPEDAVWKYDYYLGDSVTGVQRHNMSELTTPGGGRIEYDYESFRFISYERAVSVVSMRQTSGNLTAGTWAYSYEWHADKDRREMDGIEVDVWLNATTITGPYHTRSYYHLSEEGVAVGSGAGFYVHPQFQRLLVKEVQGGEKLQYGHQHRIISYENYGIYKSNGHFLGSAPYAAAPVLIYVRHVKDGRDTATLYDDHDVYGNPRVIEEVASVSFPDEDPPVSSVRTTSLAYENRENQWIIGLKTDETTTGANAVSRTYDSKGRLETEKINGVTTTYDYDNDGNLSTETNALDQTTTYLDYYRGQPRVTRYADGAELVVEIDSMGKVTKRTDEVGNITRYEYDDLGRLNKLTPPEGNETSILQGFAQTVLSRGSYQETVTLDGLGRVLKVSKLDTESGESISVSVDRDAYGRVTKEYFPNSADEGKSFTYDDFGRLLTTRVADTLISGYEYTTDGVRHTDGEGNVTLTAFKHVGSFGDNGLVYKVVNDAGHTLIVHNHAGNVQQVYQGNDEEGLLSRTYGYNEQHRLVSLVAPEAGQVSLDYDILGNLKTVRKDNGASITHYYDDRNRLTDTIDNAAGLRSSFKYYDDGKLQRETRGSVSIDYVYNANGQLETMQYAFAPYRTFLFNYGYDDDQNLHTLTYPSGNVVTYDHDAFRRVVKVFPYIARVAYYPSGNKRKIRYGNGREVNYLEDSFRRLEEMRAELPGSPIHYRYGYDNNQNIVSIADLVSPENDRNMTYDALNRLESILTSEGLRAYDYDYFNNIRGVTLDNEPEKNYSYEGQHLMEMRNADSFERRYLYDAAGLVTYIGQFDASRELSIGDTIQLGSLLDYDSEGNILQLRGQFGRVQDFIDNEPVFEISDAEIGTEFHYTSSNLLALEKYGASKTYNLHSSDSDILMSEKDGLVTEHFYFDGNVVASRELDCLSSDLDSDGDSIPDCEERQLALDPENPDTDGDTLDDGLELFLGLDPLVNDTEIDVDNDGLSNVEEINLGTDHLNPDTDTDGVMDGEEVLWKMSPLDASEKPLLRLINRQEYRGELLDQPAVDTDGHLFLAINNDGVTVRAVDKDGVTAWSQDVASDHCERPEKPHVSGPVYDLSSNRVALSVCGELTAYQADTGEKVWSRRAATSVSEWWSQLVTANGHFGLIIRELNGLAGRLSVFDSNGIQQWVVPMDYVRSVATDGVNLYTVSCQLDGLTVISHDLSGKQGWKRTIETSSCRGRIATRSISIGLLGELYILNGRDAVVLNNDGTLHSIFHDVFMTGNNAILAGKQGVAYSLDTTGHVLRITDGHEVKKHARLPSPNVAAFGLLGDGSLFHVSSSISQQGEGLQSHRLVRLSADGSRLEEFQSVQAKPDTFPEAIQPVFYPSGFYYFFQTADRFGVLNVSTDLLVPDVRNRAPWMAATGGGVHHGYHAACDNTVDTDADELPDCYEFLAGFDHRFADDASEDADSDGLTNLEEYLLGSHPFWVDSDGDVIPDNIENNFGLDVLSSNSGLDTDEDGVADSIEYLGSSSPVSADSRLSGGEILWHRSLGAALFSTPFLKGGQQAGIFASGSRLYSRLGKVKMRQRIDSGHIWIEGDRIYHVDAAGVMHYRNDMNSVDNGFLSLNDLQGVAFANTPLSNVKYFTTESGVLTAAQDVPFDSQHNWVVNIGDTFPLWEGENVGDASIGTAPVLNGNRKVSVASGKLLLQFRHGDHTQFAGELLDGPVRGSMAADRFGSTLAATVSGTVYAIHDGDILWKNTSTDPVNSGVVIGYNSIAYVGDEAGMLRAIDADGTTLWKRPFGDPIHGTPAIGENGNLFFFSGTDLVACDADGYELWRTPVDPASGTSPRIGSDGLLYISTASKGLMALFSDETGAARTDWPMEGHDSGGTGNLNGEAINNDTPPRVRITRPIDDLTHPSDRKLKLVASANDVEDGNLSDLIEWWKIDGTPFQLGIGSRLAVDLQPGRHRIAAFIRDAGLNLSSDSVSVEISGESQGLDLLTDARSPVTSGREVYLTADIEDLDAYEFRFVRTRVGDSSRDVLQHYSDIPVHVLDTSGMNGEYLLTAVAREKADPSRILKRSIRYWVNSSQPVSSLEVDFLNGTVKKEGQSHSIRASATSSGNDDYLYRFDYRTLDTNTWTLIQDYSSNPVLDIKLPLGHYRIRAMARRAGTEDKPVVSMGSFWVNSPYELDSIELLATRDFRNASRPTYFIEANAWNQSRDWTAEGQSVDYEFRIRFPGDTGYRKLREYSEVASIKLTVPNGIQSGYASLIVLARMSGTDDKPLQKSIQIYVTDSNEWFGLYEVIGEPE